MLLVGKLQKLQLIATPWLLPWQRRSFDDAWSMCIDEIQQSFQIENINPEEPFACCPVIAAFPWVVLWQTGHNRAM